ncbi:MAG: MEMO1 family protein [Thermoproteota archaeon]|nr:MEMO1 family protein [Thermoproteota archaeon]
MNKELKTRHPAVSGIFYPSNPSELRQQLEQSFLNRNFGPGRTLPASSPVRKIYGIVSPHAGYAYSGSVAANGFYQTSNMDYDTVIMIGPNHYGIGSGVATVRHGLWSTPLGEVEVDTSFADTISKDSVIDIDEFSHSKDHCLEVQIPFLQLIRKTKRFKIVPIIMMLQDMDTAKDVGRTIASAMKENRTQGFIIASSDFTHYEPNQEAHRKDKELIDAIISLDVSLFYERLERLQVSACGYGAIASTMTAVRELGASKGELLRYATSGDVTGDTSSVVGYASMLFV